MTPEGKTLSLKCLAADTAAYGGEYGTPDLSWATSSKRFKFTQKKLIFFKTKVEGIFIWENDILYIIFEGTDGVIDWMYDLFIKRRKKKSSSGKEIEIEAGFYDQAKIAESGIFEYISQEGKGIKSIRISGHSLGGALSNIFALWITQKYPDLKIQLRTFGAPNTGNEAFNAELLRCVPDQIHYQNWIKGVVDPVTTNPPEWAGYAPLPRYRVDGDRTEHWRMKWIFTLAGDTDAHYPSSYLSGLQKQ
jgi:hypothetical protein